MDLTLKNVAHAVNTGPARINLKEAFQERNRPIRLQLMFEISQDQGQVLSLIGGGVLVLTLILLPIALLTERSRATIRGLVLSGLSFSFIMSCISGYLYLWHHYYR